jgi:pyruvate/2-oxoglutarate dehydrogenase complex dihydrolipoamide acyltransferase (E2) component
MFESRKLSSNRTFIYHLLQRAQRYHCPITSTAHWDVTDTLARIERDRARGRSVGFVSFFIKATGLVLQKHPRFNDRLFHRWFRRPRTVRFDEISCNTVVARDGPGGEEILLPAVLRKVDQMSVEAIQDEIRRYKMTPLGDLPIVRDLGKISVMPRWLIRLMHRRFLRDPKFLIEKVGTYGVSALPHKNSGAVSHFTPVTQTSFFPTNFEDRVVPIEGQPTVRTMVVCAVVADHFVVDGLDLQRMGMDLKAMIEDPTIILGPEATT